MPKCHETAHFFQSSTGGSLLLSPYICSNIQNLMSSWKCSTQLIFISTYRLAPIYFFCKKKHPVPISHDNFKDMIFSIMIKIRKILDIYWEFFPNDILLWGNKLNSGKTIKTFNFGYLSNAFYLFHTDTNIT